MDNYFFSVPETSEVYGPYDSIDEAFEEMEAFGLDRGECKFWLGLEVEEVL